MLHFLTMLKIDELLFLSYNSHMKKIIVISGKQFSGKDTLAKILLQKLNDFKRIGIGDAIKIEYGKQKGLTFDEIEKNKHLFRADLIELGNKGRKINPDFWLSKLSDMDKIIVPDVRVYHEVDFFKKKGAFLLRVESSLENRAKRGILVCNDDATETALDNYPDWNLVVENDSTFDELIQKADKVINEFNLFTGSV